MVHTCKKIAFSCLISCLCMLFYGTLHAQTFNYKTREESEKLTAATIKAMGSFPITLNVWCNDWEWIKSNATVWRDSFKFKSLNAFVKFRIDHMYPRRDTNRYTYKVAYQLKGYHTYTTPTDTLTKFDTFNDTLTISYMPDSLAVYQDFQLKKYKSYFKITVQFMDIFDVTGGQTPSPITPSALPNLNFFLEGSIVSQKYILRPYGAGTSLVTDKIYTPGTDYVTVRWNLPGKTLGSAVPLTPVNYELEWTYIDHYKMGSNFSLDTFDRSVLSYDFRNNSTRVWLDSSSYRIPLIYTKGFIVYRVRMVRPDSSIYKYPIYSDWSIADDSGSLNNASYYYVNPYTNDSLNWQYTISFAEGGKYKHVLSFFDGLLKNRQSITRFNSSLDKLIVTQNIYDYEGRPGIKILPTPVNSTSFSYQYNVALDSFTNLPYKASDFDTLVTYTCPDEPLIAPLKSSSLAGRYYSKLNLDTGKWQKFVPDAGGYPMVHTIYDPGYTDRITAQGGAGPHLQVADTNVIMNYYGDAAQKTLDRVFGSDIGYSGFYRQTTTHDPNRQLSVSYKDYEGRVIMTSLVGSSANPQTHAIDALSNLPDSIKLTEDLMAGKIQQTSRDKKILHTKMTMDAQGNATFQYKLFFGPFSSPCFNQYLSVRAGYRYSVIDKCGNVVISEDSVLGTTGVKTTSTPINFSSPLQTVNLAAGDYDVHKELTIYKDDISVAVDSFMQQANCLMPEKTFIRKAIENRHFPCPGIAKNGCDEAKKRMMDELYTDAKYGTHFIDQFSGTINGNNSIYTVHVINDTPHYRYQDTCVVTLPDTVYWQGMPFTNLRTMSVDSFMMIFNHANDPEAQKIALALLPLHPEYCQSEGCSADPFKDMVTTIPDATTAEDLHLLYLDSIIAHDPLKDDMTNRLGMVSPEDSLATFYRSNMRLDSIPLMIAYCGCGDSIMLQQCLASIFNDKIAARVLINDAVKATYFRMIISLYFQNRERFKSMLLSRRGTHCSHCADSRMTLIPSPVFNIVTDSVGNISLGHGWDSLAIDSTVASLVRLGNSGSGYSPDSLQKMNNYALNQYLNNQLTLCYVQIDSIINRLANCMQGDPFRLDWIRMELEQMCNNGEVQYGKYTLEQVRTAILASGASLDDLCNPYVAEYNDFSPSASLYNTSQSCKSSDYYGSIKDFLNDPIIWTILNEAGSSGSSAPFFYFANSGTPFGSDIESHFSFPFLLAYATYSATDALYTIYIYSGSSDTIRVFLRALEVGAPCNLPFDPGDPLNSVEVSSVSCIKDFPQLNTTGYINNLAFIANVAHFPNFNYSCKVLGWTDSIETTNYSNNALAGCVPCTQMRELYQQFRDTMTVYNVFGSDHPLYNDMLATFMNNRLGRPFTADDYNTFIESCALADSMLMPLYNSYCTVLFSSLNEANTFYDDLSNYDPNISFTGSIIEVFTHANAARVKVNFSKVPVSRISEFKDFINNYPSWGITIGQPITWNLNALMWGYTYNPHYLGTLYVPAGLVVSPVDSSLNCILNGHVYFDPGYSYKITRQLTPSITQEFDCFDVYTDTATIAKSDISRAIDELQTFFTDRKLPIQFISCYQNTIDADYYKPDKQAYLNYVYSMQGLPAGRVLDTLQARYLEPNVAQYNNKTLSYTTLYNPNKVNDLYIADSSSPYYTYSLVTGILNAAAAGIGGSLFFRGADSIKINDSLVAYRCSDSSYWYRFFRKDTLYNVYLRMPLYIPSSKYAGYNYNHHHLYPVPGDSLARFFTIKVDSSGYEVVVKGMTNCTLAPSAKLSDVLLADNVTQRSVPAPMDTFNNCERSILNAAIWEGKARYRKYIDSVRDDVLTNFTNHVLNNVEEQLLVGRSDQKYSYTLYYYDRAGNLINTVPPEGVRFMDTTILDTVARCREQNKDSLRAVHKKVSVYEYNTLNQVIKQITPDAGETKFWYDAAGRLIMSQNANQKSGGYYTYNLYDKQGRIIETGQSQLACPYFNPFQADGNPNNIPPRSIYDPAPCIYLNFIKGEDLDDWWVGNVWDRTIPPVGKYVPIDTGKIYKIASPYPSWLQDTLNLSPDSLAVYVKKKVRTDVVMTIYDTVAMTLDSVKGLDAQTNLRKRVAAVKYFETLSPIDTPLRNYTYCTHYSYDIAGNVQTLVQDFPELQGYKQRYKRIDYDYDLISGKVNMLSYNRGNADQFYQRYAYDDDNRIKQVETSNDGYKWNRDAAYDYYDHGPLARVSVGDLRIQGIDYAYTIQGWLKAINSDTLDSEFDMGHDNAGNSIHAGDVVAGTLDYFSGDYSPIGNEAVAHVVPPTRNLYNGNIARQTTAILPFPRLSKKYVYDQLNRIVDASNASIDPVSNTLTGLTDFASKYKYDQDGNLIKLTRHAGPDVGSAIMDSLTYYYTGGPNPDNRLRTVTDTAQTPLLANAIDLQQFTDSSAITYKYDAIGNTIKDFHSGQDTIKWNLYNKVTETYKPGLSMNFVYDGAGNRVAKYTTIDNDDVHNQEDNDFYVRDAQGNILAIYHERATYREDRIQLILAVDNAIRAQVGTSNFNKNFVVPQYASDNTFSTMLLSSAAGNGTFVAEQVGSIAPSYFMARNPDVYDAMTINNSSLLPAALVSEANHDDTILVTAMQQAMEIGRGGMGSIVITQLLVYGNYDLRQNMLDMMCVDGNDSLLAYLWENIWLTPSLGSCSGNAEAINVGMLSILPPPYNLEFGYDYIGNYMADLYKDNTPYRRFVDTFIHRVFTDQTLRESYLFTDDYLSGIPYLINNYLLPQYGNREKIMSLVDRMDDTRDYLDVVATPTQQLTVSYLADPATFIDNFSTTIGVATIDSAIASTRHSTARYFYTGAINYNANLLDMGTIFDQVRTVLDKQNLHLAEHDIYGSSRLGIKTYWPNQVNASWDYATTPTTSDTFRLCERKPWYSLEYQDDIAADSINLYGNQLKDEWVVSHVLGQKQYEMTDHLGDVLATVTDSRVSKEKSPSNDTITHYNASIKTAFDYYPFGMLMPGRYTQDTTTHCALLTRTKMVPVPIDYNSWVVASNGFIVVTGSPNFTDYGWGTSISTTTAYKISYGVDVEPGVEYSLTPTGYIDGLGIFSFGVEDSTATYGFYPTLGGDFSPTFTFTPNTSRVYLTATLAGSMGVTGILNWQTNYKIKTVLQPRSFTELVCDKYDGDYRYGHNGQMKTNEWAGIGNHYTAKFWEYDSRTGRRLNLDPVDQISISNYASFANSPIINKDVDGNTPAVAVAAEGVIIGGIVTAGMLNYMWQSYQTTGTVDWTGVLDEGRRTWNKFTTRPVVSPYTPSRWAVDNTYTKPIVMPGSRAMPKIRVVPQDKVKEETRKAFYHVTYQMKDDKGNTYVGRTSGFGTPAQLAKDRASGHHATNRGFDPKTVVPTSAIESTTGSYSSRDLDPAYYFIRASENEQIKGFKEIGKSGNKIMGISDNNKNKDLYNDTYKAMDGTARDKDNCVNCGNTTQSTPKIPN